MEILYMYRYSFSGNWNLWLVKLISIRANCDWTYSGWLFQNSQLTVPT